MISARASRFATAKRLKENHILSVWGAQSTMIIYFLLPIARYTAITPNEPLSGSFFCEQEFDRKSLSIFGAKLLICKVHHKSISFF